MLESPFPYSKDYFWKEGEPYSRGVVDSPNAVHTAFRIVHDPYRKNICIERYVDGRFDSMIYDSLLLDFRTLQNEATQTAWRKETLDENDTSTRCVIFNEFDRAVLLETYEFDGSLCRVCRMQSPHGFDIARQQMHYESLGDPFSGVILFDAMDHPVMQKRYAVNESGEFTELLETTWDMELGETTT